jgi:hypothetical protein
MLRFAFLIIFPFYSLFVSGQLIPFEKKGKMGYKDSLGTIIVPAKYEEADAFSEGMGRVNIGGKQDPEFKNIRSIIGGKWGYVNEKGEEVIAPQYDDACAFHEGVTHVKKDGKYGYINKQGKEVIPFTFEYASCMHDKRAPIRQGNKWGYINHKGEQFVPYQFEKAYRFGDGLAAVAVSNKLGFIDTLGNFVIQPIYDVTWTYFKNGLCDVGLDGGKLTINTQGEIIKKPGTNSPIVFKDKNKKYGLQNPDKSILVAGKYDELKNSGEGFFRFKSGEKWGILNSKGEEIVPAEYENIETVFLNGKIWVKQNGLIGQIDTTGKTQIGFIYQDANYFSHDGLTSVKQNDKYGIIDATGKVILPFENSYIQKSNFKNQKLYYFKKDGKYGYLNAKGEIVLPAIYDDAESFFDGFAKVKIGKRSFKINEEGKEVE